MSKWLILFGAVLLAAVLAIGWTDGRTTAASSAASVQATQASSTASGQLPIGGKALPIKATRQVETGALTWQILSSATSQLIKNQYLPATAKGLFLILDVAATDSGEAPVLLNGNHIELKLGGAEYAPDSAGDTALNLGGHKLLSDVDLDAGATATGWIAFDIPATADVSSPELCLGAGAASSC
jgi:Domain of unknown function (DUF4352)